MARSIDFARSNGIDFSIRSGGHDMLGASTTASGVLIDLCCIDTVELDAATGVVRVGAGARSGAVTAAGKPFGLAPILGMSPNVGVGGLTLGGGMGWLSGTYGATVDHLLAVEVVTADGRLIKADARNEPDLFWALRGGGGNFGAATSFTLQMQRLRKVLAGQLSLKVDPLRLLQFLRGFLIESGDALDMELSFEARNGGAGDLRLCWSGATDAGERALGPLRTFAPILRDTVRVRDFAEFATAEPHVDNMFLRGGEFDRLTDDLAEAVADVVGKGAPEGCSVGLLHFMHGALCRPPADTPFNRPFGHVLYNIAASWQGADLHPGKVDWVIAAYEAMRTVSAKRTYINYLCEEGDEAVRSSFGVHFDRLRSIKCKYDPDNVFNNNRNIRS